MKRIGSAVLLVAGCVALGCSSPPAPERAYYLLRGAPAAALAAASAEQRAGIAEVTVAPYLDRAGIVVGLGPHEVREARFHLWAEPLRDGIHTYLEDRISAKLGYLFGGGRAAMRGWEKRVAVDVRELHALEGGDVRLVAGFTVSSRAGEILVVEQVTRTTRQASPGYAALLDAHIELLDELADSIASALQ